jgi:hypothetical protein
MVVIVEGGEEVVWLLPVPGEAEAGTLPASLSVSFSSGSVATSGVEAVGIAIATDVLELDSQEIVRFEVTN